MLLRPAEPDDAIAVARVHVRSWQAAYRTLMNTETVADFTSANGNTKLVKTISNLVRRARLDYEGFRRVCSQVRKEADLRRPPRSRRLPRILPQASLKRFFDAVQGSGNLQHEIMLKLLFLTAVRVSELTNIRVEDVDLGACKIFIELGKGKKDRYILFPESFRLILKAHLAANSVNRFLFESRQRTKFSSRRVQQIVANVPDGVAGEGSVAADRAGDEPAGFETASGENADGGLERKEGTFVFLGCTIRKKRSIQRKPRMYFVQRWPSPKQSGSRKRRLPGRRRRHRQHWRRHTSWPATTHPECGARRSRLARGTSPGRARRLRSGRAAGHSAEDRPTCRRR
jgi:integrase/recombinase XerD